MPGLRFGRATITSKLPEELAGLSPVCQGCLAEPVDDGYEEGVSCGREAVAAIGAALVGP